MTSGWVVCVDFGSTFTKAALVDVEAGVLLGTTQHRTTIPDAAGNGDVLDGYDACVRVLEADHPGAATAPTLACSSAGGGLRIAVLGNEALVTAEAGRRVALSSGGKVLLVLDGGLDADKHALLEEAQPDVLLLVGGTDGGNSATLVHDADFLARAGWARAGRGRRRRRGAVGRRSAVRGLAVAGRVRRQRGAPHRGAGARVGTARDP
ncbi:uncharacterized protein (TIGR01319 family) [Marmoricola sp. URHA0025 HA25]